MPKHDPKAFKVGDIVEVVDVVEYAEGWDLKWNPTMSGIIGERFEIVSNNGSNGYELLIGAQRFWFPSCALELVKSAQPAEDKQNEHDVVNHPKHYLSHPSGIECIQVTEHYNFNIGNVIKYVWRSGLKDGNSDIQDLKKASWYLNREINRLESLTSPKA